MTETRLKANQQFSPRKIVVIGELNVDLVAMKLTAPPVLGREVLASDFQMTLGSASAIFVCQMTRLGYPVTFISKIGDDPFGQFCLKELRNAGVPTGRVRKDPRIRTGVTIALSASKDRALITYPGAIAQMEYAEIPLQILRGHSHLHMTSYFLQERLRPSFAAILAEARQEGLTTSFDPNSDPSGEWKDEIRDVFAQTDVLFLNRAEALELTRCRTVRQALRALGQSASCVVIKLGAKGAIAIKEKEIVSAPGFKVKAVDTTGAGDSFDAGFIAGYLEGKTARECLEMGNVCGAFSTLRAGGTNGQPNRDAVEKRLKTGTASR